MNDFVTLGFAGKQGMLVPVERIWLQEGTQEFVFRPHAEAVTVVLDPYFGVIDRVQEDNRCTISSK